MQSGLKKKFWGFNRIQTCGICIRTAVLFQLSHESVLSASGRLLKSSFHKQIKGVFDKQMLSSKWMSLLLYSVSRCNLSIRLFSGGGGGGGAGGRRGVGDGGVQMKARKKKASPFLLPPPPPPRKAWHLGYLYCESTETASGTEDEWNLFHIFLNFWQRFWCYRRWCRLRFNPRMIFKSVSGVNIIPIKNYCWKSESVARANPEFHFRIETAQADI